MTGRANQKGCLILIILMVSGIASHQVYAKYGGGSGTPENPYLIYTAEQMNDIGADSNDWNNNFKLMADINLSDFTGTSFNIIGNWSSEFTGVFDGNSHTISNFTYTCSDTGFIGLFGYVYGANAQIKNLGLIDPNVDAGTGWEIGSLVGFLYSGTISNCYARGGSVSGYQMVGGLIGLNYQGTISNCFAKVTVSAEDYGAGGLVGENQGPMNDCYATGDVAGYSYVGGLLGRSAAYPISNCWAIGDVSGSSRVGGLIGYTDYDQSITNCYATGNVSSGMNWGFGGLIGENYAVVTNCYATGSVIGQGIASGGLIGLNRYENAIVSNCYSTGKVVAGSYSTDEGGLVGYWEAGPVIASFWDIQSSGLTYSHGGIGKTTAQMQTKSTFTSAGWDFNTPIWTIDDGLDYPGLSWEEEIPNRVLYVPSVYPTIKDAVEDAINGDTVLVAPGTYTGPDNREIDFRSQSITVRSESGPENTIIDCQNSGRGFYFHRGENINSVVSGFTIKNGYAARGGAISCVESNPTISNCIIKENSAYELGGGIYSAININSTYRTHPVITGCSIFGNSSINGGGIYSSRSSGLKVNNCTISGNSAINGAIPGRGGGICCYGGTPAINNCILWNNSAQSAGNQLALRRVTSHPLTLIVSYSDVQGGSAAVYIESGCNLVWDLGNINIDPLLADADDYHLKSQAGRWDPNSQSWVTDDITSPCIDSGNPGSPLGEELLSLPIDPDNQWGRNLRIDMGAFGGTAQASMPPYDWAILGDLTNDGLVNLDDYTYQVTDWLNSDNQQPGDLNRDDFVDISDLALLVEDWLSQTTWHEFY